MKILIVGAGPAGLATALFLDPKQHDITVIEKEKEFTTMGYGIFFFNEGKQLLRKASHNKGLQELLKQIGYKKYTDEDAKTLTEIHYNKVFHVNHYDAITSIKREDLHTLLRKNLSKAVNMKMGTTIVSISNLTDHAKVQLSDGTKQNYDLVISAEGSHSQLRDMFFSYSIRKLPWIARYFWIEKPMARFEIEWSRDATVMCMPHRDKTTVLSIEHNDTFSSCSQNGMPPQSLLKFYSSIGVSESALEKCYRESHISPMQYVYTEKWFQNRVVLIGDAQHAMTPTLGLGTSLALDDAYQLAMAINQKQETSIEAILTKFSRKRSFRIKILRMINRYEDLMTFRRSKAYFNFWKNHKKFMTKVCLETDRVIRLGWKYSERY